MNLESIVVYKSTKCGETARKKNKWKGAAFDVGAESLTSWEPIYSGKGKVLSCDCSEGLGR